MLELFLKDENRFHTVLKNYRLYLVIITQKHKATAEA